MQGLFFLGKFSSEDSVGACGLFVNLASGALQYRCDAQRESWLSWCWS